VRKDSNCHSGAYRVADLVAVHNEIESHKKMKVKKREARLDSGWIPE